MITVFLATGPAVLAVFTMVRLGAAAALVNRQLMSAPITIAAPGIVTAPVLEVATGLTFNVMALLLSVQTTPDDIQLALKVSVNPTAVPVVVTRCWTGEAGVATPATVVEIFAGVVARLLLVKLNGPPKFPVVIFCTRNKGVLS